MKKKEKRLIILRIIGLFIFLSAVFLLYDMIVVPEEISFGRVEVFHANIIEERGAERLVGKQYVDGEGFWAVKGYNLYFKEEGNNHFQRIDQVPVSFWSRAVGNSRILRFILGRYDFMEVKELESGYLLMFAGDSVFRAELDDRDITSIKKVAVSNQINIEEAGFYSITETDDGVIYLSENNNSESFNIWQSQDQGLNWEIIYQFSDGDIGKINAVQFDPYSDKVWITTGKKDSEIKIGYLDDENGFEVIGEGSQKWNTGNLIFTEDKIYWGMRGVDDLYSQYNIWKWYREEEETEVVRAMNAPAHYATGIDNVKIFTAGNENSTFLYVTRDGEEWFEGAQWRVSKFNKEGNLPVIAGSQEKRNFYLSKINLNERSNELVEISVLGDF